MTEYKSSLDEDSSRFFWPVGTQGALKKTYENFEKIFRTFPGVIREDTGSSHFKLYCLDGRGEVCVGGIWKYHGGMDRFEQASVKHLLRYVEKSGRIPWKKASEADRFLARNLMDVALEKSITVSTILDVIFSYQPSGYISISADGKEFLF